MLGSYFFSMDRLVNFLRLLFFHAEDIHQILQLSVAQVLPNW